MTHVTCMLTAKNPHQLRNPTLGNRVRAIFLRGILETFSCATQLKLYDSNNTDDLLQLWKCLDCLCVVIYFRFLGFAAVYCRSYCSWSCYYRRCFALLKFRFAARLWTRCTTVVGHRERVGGLHVQYDLQVETSTIQYLPRYQSIFRMGRSVGNPHDQNTLFQFARRIGGSQHDYRQRYKAFDSDAKVYHLFHLLSSTTSDETIWCRH